MMNPLLYVYGTLLAVIAAVPGFVAVIRQRSGRVRTTEADTLWRAVDEHNKRVEGMADRLQATNERLTETNERLQTEVEQRRQDTEECKVELAAVRSELARVKAGGA